MTAMYRNKEIKYTTGRKSAPRVNITENVRHTIRVPKGYNLVKKDPVCTRMGDEPCLVNCPRISQAVLPKVGV